MGSFDRRLEIDITELGVWMKRPEEREYGELRVTFSVGNVVPIAAVSIRHFRAPQNDMQIM